MSYLKQLKWVSLSGTDFVLSGHFLLTNLLLDTMKATAKSTGIEGRIVNLSSVAHHHTYPKGIDFDKLNDEKMYVYLWFFVGIDCWSASNDLLLADTMTRWLMDSLSWQTYCMRRSSLEGWRYFFGVSSMFITLSGRIETWRETICPSWPWCFGLLHYHEALTVRGN